MALNSLASQTGLPLCGFRVRRRLSMSPFFWAIRPTRALIYERKNESSERRNDLLGALSLWRGEPFARCTINGPAHCRSEDLW
jgi:hypothetical protein